MDVIKIKSNTRGRPLEIKVDEVLSSFIKNRDAVVNRLAEIRRTTRGERDEAILGSETTLPKGIRATIDVLQELKRGKRITYDTAKELKRNIRMVKELASRQERVYSRALADAIKQQYTRELETQMRGASKFAKKQYTTMRANIEKMSKQQQQKFFTSRHYQAPKHRRRNYETARQWATNDLRQKGINQQLTSEEALAYIEAQKQQEYLREIGLNDL